MSPTTKLIARLAVAIGLIGSLAAPALAQSAAARHDTYHAYGQQRDQTQANGWHSPNSNWDVYNSRGQYVGSDPDPRIRDMLRNDPSEGQQ